MADDESEIAVDLHMLNVEAGFERRSRDARGIFVTDRLNADGRSIKYPQPPCSSFFATSVELPSAMSVPSGADRLQFACSKAMSPLITSLVTSLFRTGREAIAMFRMGPVLRRKQTSIPRSLEEPASRRIPQPPYS